MSGSAKIHSFMVIQVWLKLSWPWIGAIVAMLKEKGYLFGGILPQ